MTYEDEIQHLEAYLARSSKRFGGVEGLNRELAAYAGFGDVGSGAKKSQKRGQAT